MSRLPLRLEVADVSAFASALRGQLAKLDHAPGHVELLNMVCRAVGYRNYQQFRAGAEPGLREAQKPSQPPEAADRARADKAGRYFDAAGRLTQWPARASQAELCLWVLWSRIPAGAILDERGISALLDRWHTFGDHALLRRALYDYRLVDRTRDGREYRRIEQKPPAELRMVLDAIGAKVA
jgi:hypothetical protein